MPLDVFEVWNDRDDMSKAGFFSQLWFIWHTVPCVMERVFSYYRGLGCEAGYWFDKGAPRDTGPVVFEDLAPAKFFPFTGLSWLSAAEGSAFCGGVFDPDSNTWVCLAALPKGGRPRVFGGSVRELPLRVFMFVFMLAFPSVMKSVVCMELLSDMVNGQFRSPFSGVRSIEEFDLRMEALGA